jgi:sigma-B regulation protein RsbQ
MARPDQHNVHVSGVIDGPPMVFAHGYGCDQNMWRLVSP